MLIGYFSKFECFAVYMDIAVPCSPAL